MKFLVNADERSISLGLPLAQAFGASVTILESRETTGQGAPAVEQYRNAGIETDLITRRGDWLRALRVVTRAFKYDLVIVGKMWRGGIVGFVLGSIPRALLTDVRTNLLIVRHRRASIHRLLLAIGGGPTSKQVLRWGGLVSRAFDAQPVLYHVTAQLPGMFIGLSMRRESLSQFMRSNTREARAFQVASDTLRLLHIEPELKLGYGEVVQETLEEARAGKYDLIVIGSSYLPRNSMRLFAEPVTEHIVQRAPCPVLIVRDIIDPGIFSR